MIRLLLASVLAGLAAPVFGFDDYVLGPDSFFHPGVPRGRVTAHTWTGQVFAGTRRNYWVYAPAPYEGSAPLPLIVVQDGGAFLDPKRNYHFDAVLDNLISKKEIPPMIGIFIDPGKFTHPPLGGSASDRSFEYDTLSDRYARLLREEILPEVGKTYRLTSDPDRRAICGSSSGGICAFTVAWGHPDVFRKVISFVGSFTAIAYRPAAEGRPMQPGGDLYPTLIRRNPIKPLKIFLQDGTHDLDNAMGNWHLANLQMLSALQWADQNADETHAAGPRYQVNYAWGDGGHTGKHGGAILPDILRWIWSDLPSKP